MDSNERFAMAMEAAYPHFAINRAETSVKEPIPEIIEPKPVKRDVIHIASTKFNPDSVGWKDCEKLSISIQIIRACVHLGEVTKADLESPSKHHNLVHWRFVAFHVLRSRTSLSLPAIAARLGRNDHGCVLHGLRKVKTRPYEFTCDIARVERLINATT